MARTLCKGAEAALPTTTGAATSLYSSNCCSFSKLLILPTI